MISPSPLQSLAPHPCRLLDWGLVPYSKAWEVQQQLVQERRDNPDLPDVLILLEHPPVYTLGLGSKLEFLKFDSQRPEPELHRV
ncbi:MAG: lipoyl(octanoyl) transferase, partial [Oscillatoriales cyanobacterium RU_3_3]|nr:lipoyl(octanoyl) transferase [Oscillatoriales cyanobacterium RU_3_3]